MTFIWPWMLVLLLVTPLLVAFYLYLERRRRRFSADYGHLVMAQEASGRRLGARRHLPPALFLLGLTILLFGLARPQALINLPRTEGTIILAFDVSGSMAATDMSPTRMEAAKVAARAFVERQPPTVQIGVVSFSDNGFSVQTPTDDQAAVVSAINRLSPQRGTSLGQGILVSLNTILASLSGEPPAIYSKLTPTPGPTPTPVPKGTYIPAVVIMLSDGENNEQPDPLAVAQLSADRGVRIYTIGIGSAAGTTLKVNGFTVHTQLNEPLLQQIAQVTDGTYYNADNQEDLQTVYESLTPQLVIKPQWTELTALFAGGSVLVFLLGAALSLRWFGRVP